MKLTGITLLVLIVIANCLESVNGATFLKLLSRDAFDDACVRPQYPSSSHHLIHTLHQSYRERVRYWQPAGPNPLHRRDDTVDQPRAMGV